MTTQANQTNPPSQRNPFVRSFIPGLIVGLICGGLAGAILPPILERYGATPDLPRLGSSKPAPAPAGPRDTIPGQPKPDPEKPQTPVDPVKEEPKPMGEQPTPGAPTAPETSPTPAPK